MRFEALRFVGRALRSDVSSLQDSSLSHFLVMFRLRVR